MYRWVILGAGILAYGTSQFSRQNFTGVQKYIAADLHLDKGAIGLLASVFFYSYAFFQMPWGVASDKFGSRWVIGLGILLTAAPLGFAAGQSETSLLLWRVAAGIAAAAVYVPLTGMIARWFPATQRGMSQATLGGVGGTLGEGTAYFLLPVIAVYFASGWRQGMTMVAGAIAAMGVLCLLLLRTAPAHAQATTRKPFSGRCCKTQLWCYALLSGFIRGTQTWIAKARQTSISAGKAWDWISRWSGRFARVPHARWSGAASAVRSRENSPMCWPGGDLSKRGAHRMAALRDCDTAHCLRSVLGRDADRASVLLGMSVNLFSWCQPPSPNAGPWTASLVVPVRSVGLGPRAGRRRLSCWRSSIHPRQRVVGLPRYLADRRGRHVDHGGDGDRLLCGPFGRVRFGQQRVRRFGFPHDADETDHESLAATGCSWSAPA